MNATEEWLRYIENRTLRQRYNINDDEDNSQESSQETTKDSDDV